MCHYANTMLLQPQESPKGQKSQEDRALDAHVANGSNSLYEFKPLGLFCKSGQHMIWTRSCQETLYT